MRFTQVAFAGGVVGLLLGWAAAANTAEPDSSAGPQRDRRVPRVRPTVTAEKDVLPPGTKVDGYKAIWYSLNQFSKYGDKYSGGLGTYTANHVPMAIYAPEVEKTFFIYGGAKDGQRYLLDMVSYYDHKRQVVPRPVVVHDKRGVDDPHDNPSLCIDGQGYLWVFVSGRATARKGYIYRSTEPYSIDAFELIEEREMTYCQPRWIEGQGFLHLFSKYEKISQNMAHRNTYWTTSPDGRTWSEDRTMATIGGSYQTSHHRGNKVFTAFNMHPGGNVDGRTNLYFLQTDDGGETWLTVSGDPVNLPLLEADNPALVRDYQKEKRLVYIHDLDLDRHGRPVILYVTSRDCKPGKYGDPRWWTVAHATADGWEYSEVTSANHNYSTGALYVEDDGTWRIIGPTEPGPQPVGSGGEVAVWTSRDEGKTWQKECDVTTGSPRNHNYVRRSVNAHPDFYAFWADGNPDEFSPSYLYFANREGTKVWRLPYDMEGEFAPPEPVTGEANR